MKLIFSLATLFISISLLLSHTNSYNASQIQNSALLSISSEDSALIAITYKQKKMTITNNTKQLIVIESIKLVDHGALSFITKEPEKKESGSIIPGENKEFQFKENMNFLSGKSIQINVHWNGGKAAINSVIPEQNE